MNKATQPSPIKTTAKPEKIEVIRQILADPTVKTVNWEEIMSAGVLADVHIGRARMRKHLNYKDLGIHIADEKQAKAMAEVFDLGMKNLLPNEVRQRFTRIDDAARRMLERYSLKTRLGYFIPVTGYFAWRQAMDEIEQNYFAARDEVFANYEDLKKQVEKDYVEAARSAYRFLSQINPEALTEKERIKEAVFLVNARRKVRAQFPKKESILASFEFSVETSYIDLALLSGGTEKEREVTEGVTGLQLDELRWEQEAVKSRRKLMDEMNADLVKRARAEKKEKIDGFLNDIVLQVRGILYEACAGVLSSLNRSETIQPRSVYQLKCLLENLNNLKFFPDQDVDRSMTLIRDLLENRKEGSKAEIETTLQRIAVVMRSTLIPLGYEEREEREDGIDQKRELAGIPANPSHEEVREARMALNFSMPAWDDIREEREEETYVLTTVGTGDERIERSW